jgi:hypothetical protein
LPGRQHRQLTGAGRARTARPAKGQIASIQILLGCFV